MLVIENRAIEGIGTQVAYKDEAAGIAIVEQEAFGVRQIFVESEKEMFGLKAVISNNEPMILTLNEPVFYERWPEVKARGDEIVRVYKEYLDTKNSRRQ